MTRGTAPILYLGIDPGVTGGLVVLDQDRTVVESVTFDKLTERQVWEMMHHHASARAFAVLEKVGGYVKGSGGNKGHAMFRFGQSYGFLRGCLTAAGIPYTEVAPLTWQRGVGFPQKKGETHPQRKKRLRQRAEQLFPGVKVTNATADALLLAWHCRQRHGRG